MLELVSVGSYCNVTKWIFFLILIKKMTKDIFSKGK